MEAVQTRAENPNPDTIWAILQENALQMKELRESQRELRESQKETDRLIRETRESQKETDRLIRETRESQKETDRQIRETRESQKETDRQMKETDRQMKETDRRLGKLGNRFGEVIEYMVLPNLIQKFRELGFVFTKAYPQADIEDRENKIYAEIDITLENGDKVMIVEVKSKPTTEDVAEHIERMQKVRAHADLHGDKRVFLGAIAGMIIKDNLKQFVLKNGFYVIEPSGDTFTITVPKGEYSPREW